jgi:TM2 domain-containing membrane protein YozV
MATVIIPVLLCFFLGPGVGQLYNKEFKKGAILILLSFVALIVTGVWYFKALQPYLPSDLSAVDPAAMQDLLRNAAAQVTAKEGYVLSACEAILMVLWLYGIVDAYLVSQKKRTQP